MNAENNKTGLMIYGMPWWLFGGALGVSSASHLLSSLSPTFYVKNGGELLTVNPGSIWV